MCIEQRYQTNPCQISITQIKVFAINLLFFIKPDNIETSNDNVRDIHLY